MTKGKYDISEHGPKSFAGTFQIEHYTIGQWCPSPDGSGKPEAIAISFKIADGCEIFFRLKSRHMVNTFIEIMEKHRDEVWPLNVKRRRFGHD